MARVTSSENFETVINAAQQWIRNCLISDRSVFSADTLWTPEIVAEVRQAFVDHPDEGGDDFSTKLRGQMKSASLSAQHLMAEMLWALLLFPSNIKTSTKRQQVSDVWSLSGGALTENLPMLSNDVLSGIGSGGPGFNNHRWREMVFLISLVEDLKQRASQARHDLLSDYDAFVEWIEHVPQVGHRQFRQMLRYFAFPDRVERMSSNRERWAVLDGFGVASPKESATWTDRKLDEALLALRRRLENELPGQLLDFYTPPLRERWRQSGQQSDQGVKNHPAATRRFWVEKTIVKNRLDRQTGEHALGRALWCPQRAEGGRDIYRQMREVKPGDVVFHFVDNEAVKGFSVAAAHADSSSVGLPGTEWAGRPAYRIPLKEYQQIEPPIERNEFLQEPRYRTQIERLLENEKGLFFNREFNLNQGSYITEAPLKLVQILDDVYRQHTGHSINDVWGIPPLVPLDPEPSDATLLTLLRRYHDEQIIFNSSAQKRRYAIASIDAAGIQVERLDADEPQRVTFAQAEKLIQRVRGAGSIDFASLDVTSAVRNTVLQAEPLALTADQKRVVFLADNPARLQNFLEVIDNLNRANPLYKPAMLLCVLEGIDSGELSANRITFDWIAPRFIQKMKTLGKDVTEREVAQPYYHLTGDFIWLHAVPNRADLMQEGSEGPAAARQKIKYALLKDTYWNLLQEPACRAAVRSRLETIMTPKLSLDQIVPAAENAIKDTCFVCTPDLLRRFLSSIASKPFVILTGNSGTGKTKLAHLVAHWLTGSTLPSNNGYAVVPVGADWTDNRSIVGFVNHLRKDGQQNPVYQSTPVLDLLLRATADQSRPYFLILDEMNLSHVERYFSDFLSAIESKKPIPLHQEKQELVTTAGDTVPRVIDVPDNLFVIGTVNVDETTYMFSPKVLDRANVLEFRIGPGEAEHFLASVDSHIAPIAPNMGAAVAFLELSRRARGLGGSDLRALEEATGASCRQSLQDLFALLHRVRLEFAFRTLAEVMRYLRVDFALSAQPSDWQWQACLDAQILQKILPKLHGSRRRLEAILVSLAIYCETRDVKAAQEVLEESTNLTGKPLPNRHASIPFALSHTKLLEMIEAVRRDQFVSFIQ